MLTYRKHTVDYLIFDFPHIAIYTKYFTVSLLEPIYRDLKLLRLSQEKIDEIVEGLKASSEAISGFHRQEIARLEKEYNILQNRIDRLPELLLDGLITREVYEKNLREWKDRQYEITAHIEGYTRGDQEYHVTASRVLSLARRALEIFESSEVPEKRQLLGYLLQNPRLEGQKLLYELKSPFDAIVSIQGCPMRCPARDSNAEPKD